MGIRDCRRSRAAGLAGLGAASTAPRTTGRGAGPRPTSTSPPARSAPGCTRRACAGFPVVGWAERGGDRADRPRQLGAALPRHLGHRPRRARAVRAARARGASATGCVDAALPPPRRRADRRPAARSTGVRGRGAGAERRSSAAQPSSRDVDRRLRAHGAGRDRHLRRHRRQPRPRPRRTGRERLGTPPQAHGLRRARPRRRPDARRSPRPPAAASSTATACGTTPRACATGTRSGRTTASASCPARRRCGSTRAASACRRRCFPGFDTLGTLEHILADRLRLLLVRADPEDHREGVRALGLRAEPRPHRQELAAGAEARRGRRRAGAGRGVQGATARTSSSSDDLAELVARHERADRRAACSTRPRCERRSRRATARSTTPSPRTRRSPPSAARATTSATS